MVLDETPRYHFDIRYRQYMALPLLAGWYPDPENNQRQRYWAGRAWTSRLRSGAEPPCGWYPSEHDTRYVRFWDGERWLDAYEPDPRYAETTVAHNVDDVVMMPEASTAPIHVQQTAQAAVWVPSTESVTVAEVDIGGMVYYGERLPSQRVWGRNDPSLIDPSLPVKYADEAYPLGHDISYRGLGQRQRGRYLTWLNKGRPYIDEIGYVFLFYYGLERRLLIDDVDEIEQTLLLTEVKRLADIHGHRRFSRYAERLIQYIEWKRHTSFPLWESPPPHRGKALHDWTVDVQLGLRARDELPLSDEWAWTWLMQTEPQLPMAATRCPLEFQTLFRILFNEQFPGGMRLIASQRPLLLTYAPASGSLTDTAFTTETTIPKLRAREKAVDALEDIARTAGSQLATYARKRTAEPADILSVQDIAALPERLHTTFRHPSIIELETWIDEHKRIPLLFADVAEALFSTSAMTAAQKRSFVAVLAQYDMILFERKTHCIYIPNETDTLTVSEQAQLAAIQYVLDGAADTQSHLSFADRPTAVAYLSLYNDPPSKNELAKLLKPLTKSDQQQVRNSILSVASMQPSTQTTVAVQYIYSKLGFAADDALPDVHRGSADQTPETFGLDFNKIQQTQQSSQEVASLLHDIFTEDIEPPPEESAPEKSSTGLDLHTEYQQFYETLITQESWEPARLQEVAHQYGVMLSGALELINEQALEKVDDVVCIVYDDSIDVQLDVVEEIHGNYHS